MIEGLALTNANYTEDIKLLQDRYGQPHKVRSALMKALSELPKPSGELVSLRMFYDCLQGYIHGLDARGKKEDSYEDLPVPTIQEKLPGNVRKLIARDRGNRELTLADFGAVSARRLMPWKQETRINSQVIHTRGIQFTRHHPSLSDPRREAQ